MIHLTNEEYDNLLRQIDEKTEYITVCVKERNEQKQQINNLKTEILIINNDAVNSGDEAQMEITGRVIEAFENTIVDDWRVEE